MAVKVFEADEFNESKRKRLNREIEILQKLKSHPNILTCYHVTEVANVIFLALEHTFSDLFSLIEDRKKEKTGLTEERVKMYGW